MNYLKYVFFLIFLLAAISAQTQEQEYKNAVGLTVGANYSDVNYGSEFLSQYLPKDDYLFYSASGDAHYAYNFGATFTRSLSNKFSASIGLIYTVLEYKIDGSVANQKPEITRPPSPTIPISVDGVVKYSFFDLQLAANYSFNKTPNKGLYVLATFNTLFHLNTNWYCNVVYEDLSEGVDKNITGIDQPDYNTMFFVGLGAGYHFMLSDILSLTPQVGMKYGLNPLVDGTLEPTLVNFEVTLNRWF